MNEEDGVYLIKASLKYYLLNIDKESILEDKNDGDIGSLGLKWCQTRDG